MKGIKETEKILYVGLIDSILRIKNLNLLYSFNKMEFALKFKIKTKVIITTGHYTISRDGDYYHDV